LEGALDLAEEVQGFHVLRLLALLKFAPARMAIGHRSPGRAVLTKRPNQFTRVSANMCR
jgi:hypothetical protein